MRLTKTDKDAFVRAVLDDVPSIDYDTQAHKLVRKALIAKKEQDAARATLESHVRGLIESVTTLEAAIKNFPEFAKYLPADRDATGTANLPAANVIAARWPKK